MKLFFRLVKKAFLSIVRFPSDLVQMVCAAWYLLKMRRDPSCVYFLCPFGIGDTLFLASFMKEYKVNENVGTVCFIVKQSHKDLPGMFSGVDKVIVSDHEVKTLRFFAKKIRKYRFGNFFYGHFILEPGWPEPGLLLGVNNISLVDIYRHAVLRLPSDCLPEKGSLTMPESELEAYDKQFAGQKNVVVLMPNAITVERLDPSFWETLAQKLAERGYTVYTNVLSTREAPIKGTQSLILPLKEFFCLSRRYRWSCIALRSGICDLLGFSDIRCTVLYGSKDSCSAWNMKNLRLPNKNITDVTIQYDSEFSETYKTILSHYPAVD